jgi:hypothetical protein
VGLQLHCAIYFDIPQLSIILMCMSRVQIPDFCIYSSLTQYTLYIYISPMTANKFCFLRQAASYIWWNFNLRMQQKLQKSILVSWDVTRCLCMSGSRCFQLSQYSRTPVSAVSVIRGLPWPENIKWKIPEINDSQFSNCAPF